MRVRLVPVLVVLALSGCGSPAPERAAGPDSVAEAVEPPDTGERALEMIWTASGFEQPEGAALAPDGGYFISNIGPGDPAEPDGNGYISKLNADGSLAAAKFAEGLNAPIGLAVHEGVLYAADSGGVAMFDAATGAPKGKVLIEGAAFLNDMTVWKGDVLVADSGTATIHKVAPEGASVLASNAGWAGLNGILGDGERLLITTMTEGKLIGLDSALAETLIATGMKDADGVGLIPGGGYLVSSWPGEIHHVSREGLVTLLVDTKADGILQNDLSVFGDVVIVPNWEPGTVTAWKITRP